MLAFAFVRDVCEEQRILSQAARMVLRFFLLSYSEQASMRPAQDRVPERRGLFSIGVRNTSAPGSTLISIALDGSGL
jgi:hypothetical protein